MKKFDFKNVSSDTWIRTTVLLFALINQALNMFGIVNKIIPMEEWTKWVSYILTVISAVWAWWKNNSFTKSAQYGDKVKDIAKENANYDLDKPGEFDDLKIEESEVDLDVCD